MPDLSLSILFYLFVLKYIFIYSAASGLGCDMWGLSLWHIGPLVVAPGLQSAQASVVAALRLSYSMACGILVP